MADASVSVLVLLLNAIWPDMLAGGVQTALEKVWKKLTAKDWEDLYFDAFELAVKKQSPSLVHYHEGQAAFNRTAFKRLLKEELHISIRDSVGSQLLSREFLVAVAGAIARRSNEIFVLPGNLLSELDYQQLTFNLVAEANSLFWTEIHRRPDAFNKEILAELKFGQERLQEVQEYLVKLEQSAQHHIREIHNNLQELNDLGKKAAEYQAVCISCAEPGLYFLVQVIQETLNAHNFRTIHLETSDIPRQVLEEEIRGCSYFFGLYSENYYDSNLINDREAISNVERHIEIARTYFRRCFCFKVSEALSLKLHPKPVKKNKPPEPSFAHAEADLIQQPYFDQTPTFIRQFEILLTRLNIIRDPYIQREEKHNLEEVERIHPKINDYLTYKKLKRRWSVSVGTIENEFQWETDVYRLQSDRQNEFLEMLSNHFPLYQIIDIGDFQRHLVKVLRESQPWEGISKRDVFLRWDEYATAAEQTLRESELEFKPGLPSPAWPLWERFCRQSWLRDTQRLTASVQQTTGPLLLHPETETLTRPLQIIPDGIFDHNWEAVKHELLSWCSDNTTAKVEIAIQELILTRKKTQNAFSAYQIETEGKNWSEAASSFLSHLRTGRFGRCFLVMGRSGAGKSHFIAELLRQQANGMPLYRCLFMDEIVAFDDTSYPSWSRAIETLLLDKAALSMENQLGCLGWHSLSDLDHFLAQGDGEAGLPIKLVVIIDDLGKWIRRSQRTFMEYLTRFIASHTFLKTFHWVITLNESDYAYVASENRFWDLYASQISDQTWISLDDLNEEGYASQSGDVLIEKNLALKEIFRANNHNPELRLSGLNRESRNLLSIPLIAWTAVDWLRMEPQKIEVLANLRYIDFIEKLYESREIKVNYHGETLEIEVRATVQEIARGLVAEGEPFSWIEEKSGEYRHDSRVFNKNEMISRLSGQSFGYTRLREDNVARVILDMLENKGFLRKPNKYHVDYFLKLDTQPYWEYQAAINNLCPVVKHETDPHQELERLFGSNGIARDYTGIFEFTLLAMEREQEIEPSRLLGLSVFALNNLPKLHSTVWTSASKTTGAYQYALVEWLKDQKISFEDQDALQYFLYFMRYAATPEAADSQSGVTWRMRLLLIVRNFAKVQEWGLVSYFTRYILGAMKKSVKDGVEFAKTVSFFRGIEDYIDPEDLIVEMPYTPNVNLGSYPLGVRCKWTKLGAWAFEIIRDLLPDRNEWELLNQWMQAMMEIVVEIARKAKVAERRQDYKEKDRMWAGILEHYYESLVEAKGIESLRWLQENDWIVWQKKAAGVKGVEGTVYEVAQEYYTVWVGRCWREKPDSRVKFRSALQDAISDLEQSDTRISKFQEITIALVIYYTISKENKNSPLDDFLFHIFQTIYETLSAETDPVIKSYWKNITVLHDFYTIQKSIKSRV